MVDRPCEELDIGRTACAMNTISMETPAKMFSVLYSITMQLALREFHEPRLRFLTWSKFGLRSKLESRGPRTLASPTIPLGVPCLADLPF